MAFVFVFVFVGSDATADDFAVTNGQLSDQDFYRLVACGATPGRHCQHSMIRWSKRTISVGFAGIDSRIDHERRKFLRRALRHALTEINQAGAGIRLVFAGNSTPDIPVYLSAERDVSSHFVARDVAGGLGKRPTGVSRIFFQHGKITKAMVVISAISKDRELVSVMLEEIVQSLGLPTDIRNRYYHGRSIFSETSSRTTRLRGQDAKALSLHYSAH